MKINENQWEINETSMKINENQWKINGNQWKINGKSMETNDTSIQNRPGCRRQMPQACNYNIYIYIYIYHFFSLCLSALRPLLSSVGAITARRFSADRTRQRHSLESSDSLHGLAHFLQPLYFLGLLVAIRSPGHSRLVWKRLPPWGISTWLGALRALAPSRWSFS